MYVQDRLPLVIVDLMRHPVPGKTGIVNQDIQLAVCVYRRLHQLGGKFGLGDITGNGDSLSAAGCNGAGGLFRRAGVEVVHNDHGPVLCKSEGGAGADSPSCTCNDNCLVGKHWW